jgi:hypothetical protein
MSSQNNDYLNSWRNLETFVSFGVNQLFKTSMKPTVIKWLNSSLINPKCSQAIEDYIDSISNMDYWAVKSM